MSTEAIGALSFVLHGNEREPVIKGTPAVIHRARALARTGEQHATQAQRHAAEDVLDRMRQEARRTPAWKDLEDGIVLTQEDGSYVFGFDPAHPGAQRATELEFGTADERPSSVFRKVLHGGRSETEWNFRSELRRWGR